MKIICHGIDLVDCRRIEKMLNRHGRRIVDRLFTAAEQRYSHQHRYRIERLAGRFAVKEAVLKMLGTGWQNGIAWTDIETTNDPNGKPTVRLTGRVAELAEKMGVEQISVSITHASDLAIASVVALAC